MLAYLHAILRGMVTLALRCQLHSQAKRCRERMQSHKESHLIAQKDKETNDLPAASELHLQGVHVRCRQRLACFEEHSRSVHLAIHMHNAVSKIWLIAVEINLDCVFTTLRSGRPHV